MELELDASAYKEFVKGIWLVIDCGEIFSIKAAETAVRLSVRQELEHLMEDASVGCAAISVSFIQSNSPPCQIDRIVHNLIPAAFASAVSQALGAPLTTLPCTKKMFFELLERQKQNVPEENTTGKANAAEIQEKSVEEA